MHMYIKWNCNTYCALCMYTCASIHVLYAYTVCMYAWQNKSQITLSINFNSLHALLHLLQYYINLCRSATRCLLIPFAKPSLKAKVSSHYKLNKCLPPVSGGIVYLIGLGKRFHEEGMQEMDERIIPQLESVFPPNAFHRVIPQYATLKWFCSKVCMHVCMYIMYVYMHVFIYVCVYVYVHTYVWMSCFLQLVRDLHLEGHEEEVDAFFATQIADTIRKYQLESSDEVLTPNVECDSTYIEHFAQKVLLWTTGRSRAEILQRMKYQPKTKQFMFVTGEIPVDPTMAAMFLRAAHPSKKNPLCFKGTARKFLSSKAAMHTPPITEVRNSHP